MDSSGLVEIVKYLSDELVPFAAAATAVGTLSMALIQTIKDMFPIRELYQRRWIRRWLHTQLDRAPTTFQATPQAAEADLLRLTVDSNASAFYSLGIEQLCGQMNSASQVALDYPSLHQSLLLAFAANANPVDLAMVLNFSNVIKQSNADLYAVPIEAPPMTDFIDARNRVSHQIQRAIDAVQIAAGFSWQKLLQKTSIIVSFILSLIGITLMSTTVWWLAFPMAIAAGFLAPVARDLVAALQNLRK